MLASFALSLHHVTKLIKAVINKIVAKFFFILEYFSVHVTKLDIHHQKKIKIILMTL